MSKILFQGIRLMNKQNITVLCLTTEYGENVVGGLGRHVTDLTLASKNQGLSYIVITPSISGKEYVEVNNHVTVYYVKNWTPVHLHFLDYIRNLNFRIVQFVLHELNKDVDLIHCHDWLTGMAAVTLQKQLGKPLISTIHSTEKERKLVTKTKPIEMITTYEKELMTKSDRLIVSSAYMYSLLNRDYDIEKERMDLIPNGILPSQYQLPRKEPNNQYPTPFILAMGRLVKEKGFDYLLEAFEEIKPFHKDLKLVIAGEGPFNEVLIRKSIELTIDDVIFTGHVKGREKNCLLHQCEMLVIPSLYEPFGIIALEGMICRRPVIAFNTGGLKEIVGDGRGILVESSRSADLAKEMRTILVNRELGKEVADRGFTHVAQNYHWDDVILPIKHSYQTLLNK